jgi:hypothetical protein
MEAYRAIRVLTYCGVEILVHSNLYRGMAGYACGARNPARMDGSSGERSDGTWLILGSNSAAATSQDFPGHHLLSVPFGSCRYEDDRTSMSLQIQGVR